MTSEENVERRVIVKLPSDFAAEELAAICDLVVEGGEVAKDGLMNRLKRAKAIAVLYGGDEPIGVAALKTPNQGYRRSVFDKAKSKLDPEDFPQELGWIVVSEECRGKGLSTKLVDALMGSDRVNVYATSNVSNKRMHKGLRRLGFIETGEAYDSVEHLGEKVSLFVRPGRGNHE